MVRKILEDGLSPREARKQIFKALSSINDKTSKEIAKGLNKALKSSFSTEYVKDFKVYGVKLSHRLYNNAKDVAGATQRVINEAIKENKTVAEVSKLLYEGYDFKDDPLHVKKNNIPKWLKEELNKPPDERSFKQASTIKTPALKAAYTQALKTKSFNMQEKALKKAFYEKSRYYANRIAQNEVMKAYSIKRAKMIADDESIEVVKVRMSRTHPRVDICDYHSGVDKYGLGKGVYPKSKAPIAPFHPFCRCRLIEDDTLSAKGADFNPKADKDFIDTLGNYEKSLVLGSKRRVDMFFKSGDVMKSAVLGSPMYLSEVDGAVALGYNVGMKKIFDSGTQKRYSRALSTNDAEIASVITIAKEHI